MNTTKVEDKVSSKRTRILELDALRGLAALMVLIFHYTTYYDVYFTHTVVTFRFWEGATGVSLFFILSGFVIFMTIEKTRHWKDFVVSRFSRLYPAYWAALLITTFAIYNSYQVSPLQFVVNLTMFQRWLKVDNIDWSYWTLYIELSFYISMLAVFYFKKVHKIETYGIIIICLMIALNFLLQYIPLLSKLLTVYPMLKYGNLFFAGILFYNIKMHGSTFRRHALIFCCFIAEFFTRFNGNYEYLSFPMHLLISLLYFGVFYLLIYDKLGFLVNKGLIFLGTISYSLYLVHQNMGYEIIKVMYEYTSNPWVIIFVPTCVSIVIAIAITFLIEKPALDYIRNKYRRVKAKHSFQQT